MNETFTVELSEGTAQMIRELASRTGRETNTVLSDLILQSISEIPVSLLSDSQVIALADMMMSDPEQAEFNHLLNDQREGSLNDDSRRRLDELLHSYRRNMVRKSEALRIAVQRGIRAPLD